MALNTVLVPLLLGLVIAGVIHVRPQALETAELATLCGQLRAVNLLAPISRRRRR